MRCPGAAAMPGRTLSFTSGVIKLGSDRRSRAAEAMLSAVLSRESCRAREMQP